MTKILIVEDDAIFSMDIIRKLELWGYEVLPVAVSGEEAIILVREQTPDIILMDITLKGDMDGIDTAKIINRESRIPIIYVTAHSDKNTVKRALSTNPAGYMVKPVNHKDLRYNLELAVYQLKLAQEQDEKLKYQTLFHESSTALLLTTLKGDILAANPAACQLFGYSEQEILDIGRDGLIVKTDPQAHRIVEHQFPNGNLEFKALHRRKDGSEFLAQVQATLVKNSIDQPQAFISIIPQEYQEKKNRT